MSSKDWDGIRLEAAPEGRHPKCPACAKRLDRLWIKKKGFRLFEQKQIAMCPYCEVFLGYGLLGRG